MADSTLSREHSLALLHKLSNDDGFRSRFEQKPAAALAELGVPHETIINLKATCLAPTTLADKARLLQAHQELANATADVCVGMNIPTVGLDFGAKS
ncbi:MAG TPA: NHLP-related RiPP peptide [Rhodanobacteraceae bacterium]|nr:NHLP-related RiPP peptide [Rhodanobacteraceae bacterium]